MDSSRAGDRHTWAIEMPDDHRSAETRLATYGSLSPGRVNHHQLAGLTGRWRKGTVRGRVINAGWASGSGYPALILDDSAARVDVHLFESPDLPNHWARLDDFEGSDYRRVATLVRTSDGDLSAYVYVSAT